MSRSAKQLRPIGTISGAPNCYLEKKGSQLGERSRDAWEKGARMHFFKKLFGSLSHSNKKNDYARATLEYATSFRTFKSDKTEYNNRGSALEAEDEYSWRFSDYNRLPQIKNIDVRNIVAARLQKQRISVALYRYLTSKTYQFISRH